MIHQAVVNRRTNTKATVCNMVYYDGPLEDRYPRTTRTILIVVCGRCKCNVPLIRADSVGDYRKLT